ncbi:MAG TPA: hypothetical protein P5511_04515 [Candidatus Goldiibacteriota bacterium]|nr:hypothetical protein [Candidatus Goldiibacteriota bacterium]
MRKIMTVIIAFIAVFSCKPMDRLNPTDKEASNFIGWTFEGSIGYFTELSDFVIATDPSDSRDYIFAIDSATEEIHKFMMDGTPTLTIANGTPKMLVNPSGICSMQGICFIVDRDPSYDLDAFQIDNPLNNKWWYDIAGGEKIETYNNMLYTAQKDPPAVYVYAYTPPTSYSSAGQWTITKGDASCDTCMAAVSDITASTTPGEFMLTDPVLMRISIFDSSGNHTGRNINVGMPVVSAAGYGDRVYVPTTDGIRIYNYSSGEFLRTIANYGVGNGRVGAPGRIRLYAGKNILVGSGTHIKFFSTQGL